MMSKLFSEKSLDGFIQLHQTHTLLSIATFAIYFTLYDEYRQSIAAKWKNNDYDNLHVSSD